MTARGARPVFAAFDGPERLLEAARRLRDDGHEVVDAHTPCPVEGLDEVLGLGRTRIRWLVLAAAVAGGALAYLIQWWVTVEAYPLNVGGRPLHSGPAFVLIAFEMAILAGALAGFAALYLTGGMPRLWHPAFEVDGFERATVDRYWLVVRPGDGGRGALEERLRALGAQRVDGATRGGSEHVEGASRGTGDGRTGSGGRSDTATLFVAALATAFAAAACESAGEERGLDLERMVRQPSADAYDESAGFSDGKAMQAPPEGAVPHELESESGEARTGRRAGEWLEETPVPVDRALLERGRERYAAFCAPCHAADGNGNAPVAGAMEVRRPPSLHAPTVRARPDGQLFDIVRGGIGLMPGYEYQLPVRDRWAVVAYVRALQEAGTGPVDPIPEEMAGAPGESR